MFRERSRSADGKTLAVTRVSPQPTAFIENENTLVWRFPIHISQSSIGGKTKLSNACTLIALKIAELIHFHNIDMPAPLPSHPTQRITERVLGGAEMNQRWEQGGQSTCKLGNFANSNKNDWRNTEMAKCPANVISCLVNGIVDGNEAYSRDAGVESTRVYNLPDAIKACDQNFAEIDFKLSTGSISDSLPKLISLAVQCPMFQSERRLIFVMIGCIRTVLIVFDRSNNSLTLFDTHMHLWYDDEKNETLKHGALIGTCPFTCLRYFADWVQNFVFPDINRTAEAFEISLVQLTQLGDRKAQDICKVNRMFKIPTRLPVFQTPNSLDNKENKTEHDYPVLRSILSTPPTKFVRIGGKRQFDSNSGEESGVFGRRMKEIRLLRT